MDNMYRKIAHDVGNYEQVILLADSHQAHTLVYLAVML